jgi:general secretion pathway protein L
MARILGLDLGSHSVKGLLLDTNTRGGGIKAQAEVRRGEGDRQETLRAALRELLAHPELQHADQVVVALPGQSLATHQLAMPFSDPKRIEATIPFEVESQLPFELSEAVFDYQVASLVKDKGSELLVGVVRREELSGLLGLLAELGVDPRVVTHPGITSRFW